MFFAKGIGIKVATSRQYHWPRRRHTQLLVTSVIVCLLAIPLEYSTLQAAEPSTDAHDIPTIEEVQSLVGQSAERKGMIWRAEEKWATADGYNWAGIESDLRDMQNARAKWVRIAFWENLPFEYYDTLLPLIAEYDIQILGNIRKAYPQKDLGTEAEQAAYRAWLNGVVTRYQETVRFLGGGERTEHTLWVEYLPRCPLPGK